MARYRTSDPVVKLLTVNGHTYRGTPRNKTARIYTFNVTDASDISDLTTTGDDLGNVYEADTVIAKSADLEDGADLLHFTAVEVADDANVATVVTALKTLGLFIDPA